MEQNDEYKKIAGIYDFLFSRALRNLRNTICTCLSHSKAKNVLDLCCGTGEQLRMLAANNDTLLTGVDLSQAMLNQARQKSPDTIHYLECNGGNTQLPSAKYDGIIITFALHEKPARQHQAIFSEACRLLHPDGQILIADYCTPALKFSSQCMSHLAFRSVERLAGINHYHCYKDWMADDGVEGFLYRNNPGKLSLISEHFKGCVKLLSVSNQTTGIRL